MGEAIETGIETGPICLPVWPFKNTSEMVMEQWQLFLSFFPSHLPVSLTTSSNLASARPLSMGDSFVSNTI